MSTIVVEVNYSRSCPSLASEVDSRLFALSGSPIGASYTPADALKHDLSFNYDCVLVARSALSRIRNSLRRILADSDEVTSWEVRLIEGRKSDIDGFRA